MKNAYEPFSKLICFFENRFKNLPHSAKVIMNNVAGLFDPGGPATVARAKRMCNSLGRSRPFSKKESASNSRIFSEKCYFKGGVRLKFTKFHKLFSQFFVENCQFSNKECAAISRFFVKNGQISKKERGVPCRPCRAVSVADSLFRPHPEQRARASRGQKVMVREIRTTDRKL